MLRSVKLVHSKCIQVNAMFLTCITSLKLLEDDFAWKHHDQNIPQQLF